MLELAESLGYALALASILPACAISSFEGLEKSAIVVVISKSSKPAVDLERYCPIFLLCVSYKILEQFIYARIEPLIDHLLSVPVQTLETRLRQKKADAQSWSTRT